MNNDLTPKPQFIQIIESLSLPFKLLFDWEVPFMAKFIPILVFILYLMMPLDIITDFIPVLGVVDDAAIFTGCAYLIVRLTPDEVLSKYSNKKPNDQEKIIDVKSKKSKK